MSKKSNKELEQAIEDMADELDIDDEDYGFIIGPDGTLKMIFMPDESDMPTGKIPATVKKILKIFKIQDAEQLETNGMIH